MKIRVARCKSPQIGLTILSNSRLLSLCNVPIAIMMGWLLWCSLHWPVIGDASLFHFLANQFLMGAVPYRDIFDVNMPVIYGIHAAIVRFGGMSDGPWRVFDLGAAAIMSGSILMLVRPSGLAAAILTLLVMLATHLLLGPYAAGQRDYLIAILAVIAAWMSALAAEDPQRRRMSLFAVGAVAIAAACIKPTALLLLFLPALTVSELGRRDVISIVAGSTAIGILVFGTLAVLGAMSPFITMMRDLMPRYAKLDNRTIPEVMLRAAPGLMPLMGLTAAAILGITGPKPPRARAMIGLTAFGLIHLLAQRKGYFYHVYPLAIGIACWGGWSLAYLPIWRAFACLVATVSALGWNFVHSVNKVERYTELRAAADMQMTLQSRLPPGARVQVLDSDRGAFLAMARAGIRQATPHIQWFSLIVADERRREEFLAALKTDPPAAVLLTDDFWPTGGGFEAIEKWKEFKTFLTSYYDLDATGNADEIDWRFYLRHAPPRAILRPRGSRRIFKRPRKSRPKINRAHRRHDNRDRYSLFDLEGAARARR